MNFVAPKHFSSRKMSGNGFCSCVSSPKAVDLHWLKSQEYESGAVSVEMVPSDVSSFGLLLKNLERYGWSPIRLQWLDKPMEAPAAPESFVPKSPKFSITLDAWQILCQYPRWKELHAELFEREFILKNRTRNESCIRFIPFESGAPGSSLAEAKQSWEYARTSAKYADTLFPPYRRLQAWTELLHAVISHVMMELKVPTTHLVVPHIATTDEVDKENEPLDLLRAFCYEPISSDQAVLNPSHIMGSSPHTDWGSWTVVWQDDTHPPCLQTYCHICQKWNSVPSPLSNPHSTMNTACFIVHVGDLTSLCLRQAINDLSTSFVVSHGILIAPEIFPSPRHRVLSPIHQKQRHSLVYFVYPPATTTPANITESLLDWCRLNYFGSMMDKNDDYDGGNETLTGDRTFPVDICWKHYSILADQSSCPSSSVEPDVYLRRWSNIQHIPVRDILD